MKKKFTILYLLLGISLLAISQSSAATNNLRYKPQNINSDFRADALNKNTYSLSKSTNAKTLATCGPITYKNQNIGTQTGNIVVQFTAIPSTSGMDGVIGLSNGPVGSYSDIACAIRFNDSNYVDARNGDNYIGGNWPYTPGTSYNVKFIISMASHTYDVYIGNDVYYLLGNDLAFRTEQSSVSLLNNLVIVTDCDLKISNLSISSCGPSLFSNRDIGIHTENFTIEFDASPLLNNIDAVAGLSNNPANDFNDLACIVRFNSLGKIDARDGSNYRADIEFNYRDRFEYHIRMVVSLSTHTYDVYVSTKNNPEYKIAESYAFRSEQASVTQLNNFSYGTSCNLIATNFAISSCGGLVSFKNKPIENQTGNFTIEFNAVPSAGLIDAVMGLSNGTTTTYDKIACSLRFNTDGFIDARNGDKYAADTAFKYISGQKYHFRVVVSLTSHKYNVYVTTVVNGFYGDPEYLLANDYLFRTEQSSVTQLNNSVAATSCNVDIDSIKITNCGGPVTFRNNAIGTQNGNFTIDYDVTPGAGSLDGVTGVSNGTAHSYSDLACIVRFNANGKIDVRDGNNYKESELFYNAGQLYHVKIIVSLMTHTYDVFFTTKFYPNGPVQIGKSLAFRTEQTKLQQLDNFVIATNCELNIKNLKIVSCPGSFAFANQSITNQTNDFVIDFKATPGADLMDGVIGLSKGAADAYTDLACIVRFNTFGYIDARNGGTYWAENNLKYNAGKAYEFVMLVSPSKHTYSGLVIEPGHGVEYTLGINMAFRTEQKSVSNLNNLATVAKSCGVAISNLSIVPYDPNQFPYFKNIDTLTYPNDSIHHPNDSIAVPTDTVVSLISSEALPVSVWPNPATNKINIKISINSVIDIRDLSGKILYNVKVYSGITELPLNLAPGLYLLRIRAEDNRVNIIKLNIKR